MSRKCELCRRWTITGNCVNKACAASEASSSGTTPTGAVFTFGGVSSTSSPTATTTAGFAFGGSSSTSSPATTGFTFGGSSTTSGPTATEATGFIGRFGRSPSSDSDMEPTEFAFAGSSSSSSVKVEEATGISSGHMRARLRGEICQIHDAEERKVYEGGLVGGEFHGNGQFYFRNGDIYSGEFHHHKFQGRGKYTFSTDIGSDTKEVYVGDFNDGLMTGGTLTGEGFKYEGKFLNGIIHGHGVLEFTASNRMGDNGGHKLTYRGEFRQGERKGTGTYHFSDGSIYHGDFDGNSAHGHGTVVYQNGQKYVGEFQNGLKHGQGIYIWWDGRRYEGEYKHDKKNGWGKYFFTNGDRYEGEFLEGKRHGKGRFYSGKDGSLVFDGEYEHGKKKLSMPTGIQ